MEEVEEEKTIDEIKAQYLKDLQEKNSTMSNIDNLEKELKIMSDRFQEQFQLFFLLCPLPILSLSHYVMSVEDQGSFSTKSA